MNPTSFFVRRILGLILGFVLLMVTLNSCVHELPQPIVDGGGNPPPISTDCSADTVYFAQSVLPLITSLCGKSGCHGTVSPREFQIIFSNASSSYNAIRNRFVSSSSPGSYSKLTNSLNEMAGQSVSGYVAPSSSQLTTLKTWISQGAKYNSCTACDTTQFAFTANIYPIINTYCTGCHLGPGSSQIPSLTTLASIQAEITNYPGRLLGSIQHTVPYNTTITAMPQSGAKLPDCYITQIKKWIAAGAPND